MAGDVSDIVSNEKHGMPELAEQSELAGLQNDIAEKVDGLVLDEETTGDIFKFSCHFLIMNFVLF